MNKKNTSLTDIFFSEGERLTVALIRERTPVVLQPFFDLLMDSSLVGVQGGEISTGPNSTGAGGPNSTGTTMTSRGGELGISVTNENPPSTSTPKAKLDGGQGVSNVANVAVYVAKDDQVTVELGGKK